MKTFAAILDVLFVWLCWPFEETNPDYMEEGEPGYNWNPFHR